MTESLISSGSKISVIIPGWNESRNILNCMESLKKQTNKRFNVFMILGGEDTTFIEMAKNSDWEQLIVLDQVGPNKMKAYNAVLGHPELGDILVFSDMDCEFPDDFLELYNDAYANKERNILTGRVRPDPHSRSFVDRYHRNFEEMIAPGSLKIDRSIIGSNFAVRKEFLLNRFGLFDESIAIGTDKAISKRFNEIGEPIYFDPRIIVYTQFFSAGFLKYINQQTRWIRIRLLLNKKSNPKAFRKCIVTLLISWLMCVVIPLSLVFSKHIIANQFILFFWFGFIIIAWLKRYRILRRGREHLLIKDLMGALGLLAIHFGIQILAGFQVISKKHKYRWKSLA